MSVIPAEAGIQRIFNAGDPRFHGDDRPLKAFSDIIEWRTTRCKKARNLKKDEQ